MGYQQWHEVNIPKNKKNKEIEHESPGLRRSPNGLGRNQRLNMHLDASYGFSDPKRNITWLYYEIHLGHSMLTQPPSGSQSLRFRIVRYVQKGKGQILDPFYKIPRYRALSLKFEFLFLSFDIQNWFTRKLVACTILLIIN